MIRIRRWAWHAAAAGSLILFAAACASWATGRANNRFDEVTFATRAREYGLYSYEGLAYAAVFQLPAEPGPGPGGLSVHSDYSWSRGFLCYMIFQDEREKWQGFGAAATDRLYRRPMPPALVVAAPLWFVAAASAVLPACWVVGWRRARARRRLSGFPVEVPGLGTQ